MQIESVRVIAPAKVNLHLGVGPVRADGFHEVTTVLHTLALADELVVQPAATLSLASAPEIIEPGSNLVWRAAEAMAAEFGREPAFEMRLVKRIPHGAGLGGGSSDAAAAIAGIAELWEIERSNAGCLKVAASLGADVPFFLGQSGCALMSGRGDVLEQELPTLEGLPVVLVKPSDPVPTGAAYAAFDADPHAAADPAALVAALKRADAEAVARALSNNMQAAACTLVPEIGDVLEFVGASAGVTAALVAGSGSTVFGICETHAHARAAASHAAGRGWWAEASALAGCGVRVERR